MPRSVYLPLLALLLALLPVRFGFAADYPQLYDYHTEIASRSDEELTRAMRVGLEEVLRRLTTGNLRSPAIVDALDRAPQFVTRSRFEAPGSTGVGGIHLRYSAGLIQSLMRDAGMAMWGPTRPAVLLVLQTAADEGERIIDDASGDQIARAVRRHAQRVGVPLQFPLMDLEDRYRITPDTVRMLDEPALQAAAARYGSEHWLAGTLRRTADGWQAAWRASLAGQAWSWQYSAVALDEVLGEALDAVFARLLARYSVQLQAAEQANVLLTLQDVDSLRDHVAALRALGNITGVRSVELDSLRDATVLFRVYLEGETRHFLDQLGIDDRFAKALDPVQDSGATLRLYYRYLR